jgi:hypothetical protein
MKIRLTSCKAAQSSHGSDVDDRAFDLLFQHVIYAKLGDHHRCSQIDRNDTVPKVLLQGAYRI